MSLRNLLNEKIILPGSDILLGQSIYKDLKTLSESQWWSEEELENYQNEKLRDLIFEGAIENLIVYSPDRLSRKYAHQVILLEEFKKNGVNVIFLKSVKGTTPEDQLLVQFQGMIAEYERAQIIERGRRGKLHKAKNGIVNVLSGAPYGYNYIKKTDVSNAYYTINETEAKTVKKIFELYTKESS